MKRVKNEKKNFKKVNEMLNIKLDIERYMEKRLNRKFTKVGLQRIKYNKIRNTRI